MGSDFGTELLSCYLCWWCQYCSGWLQLWYAWTKAKEVSERCWWFPSTMWRQVMCNTSNNDGDSALTIVPLCRGLSSTKITPGKWWKSRGQVKQTMDVTGGFIYYLYLPDDSSQSHLIWLIPESSNMTQRVTWPVLLIVLLLWWVIRTHHKWLKDHASWVIPNTICSLDDSYVSIPFYRLLTNQKTNVPLSTYGKILSGSHASR